jgi:hypothetical protein
MAKTSHFCGLSLITLSSLVVPPAVGQVQVVKVDAGSMRIPFSQLDALNPDSKLSRQSFVLTDASAPVLLTSEAGIQVLHFEAGPPRDYRYLLRWSVSAKEPIRALEIRALVYDVFGDHLVTLSLLEVADFGSSRFGDANWRIYRDHEIRGASCSIAFVWQARTAAGRLYKADPLKIAAATRGLCSEDPRLPLEPSHPKPQ